MENYENENFHFALCFLSFAIILPTLLSYIVLLSFSCSDNDGMITNKNKKREELQSALKTQNRCQHRQIERKVKPKPTAAADVHPLPTTTTTTKKEHEKVSDAKPDLRVASRQRKVVTFDLSQKVSPRNGKP